MLIHIQRGVHSILIPQHTLFVLTILAYCAKGLHFTAFILHLQTSVLKALAKQEKES